MKSGRRRLARRSPARRSLLRRSLPRRSPPRRSPTAKKSPPRRSLPRRSRREPREEIGSEATSDARSGAARRRACSGRSRRRRSAASQAGEAAVRDDEDAEPTRSARVSGERRCRSSTCASRAGATSIRGRSMAPGVPRLGQAARVASRSSRAATPASAGRSRYCTPVRAPTSPSATSSEHDDAEETKRAVEAEGRRASSSRATWPIRRTRSMPCSARGRAGRLDILVNNAAYQQHQKSLEDITTSNSTARSARTSSATSTWPARP
jgi:NAD(P)-dependent dehydrogenase (short-subunit alcohol dehydrogenase family)